MNENTAHTPDEPIDNAADQQSRRKGTYPLNHVGDLPPSRTLTPPFGVTQVAVRHYQPVPADLAEHSDLIRVIWRIELHGLAPSVAPLGLDILGDARLGRRSSDASPEIDLTPYRALEHGVSRQHALLRPTRHALYLIDLGSTNGTCCNGIPLHSGTAKALTSNDTIILATLIFQIKIVQGPAIHCPDEPQS